MGLDTDERQRVTYFCGFEVEHTPTYGKFTLFVVGTPPLEEILKLAKDQQVEQIYFGTSQSFEPNNFEDWAVWDDRISKCLENGYWVTLDFDVKHAETMLDYSWVEFDKFVPMISVKLPFIRTFNYNAVVKIDDSTFGSTNPGVWCHGVNELMNREKFTSWHQYRGDFVLK
jgi:hypothetical protein